MQGKVSVWGGRVMTGLIKSVFGGVVPVLGLVAPRWGLRCLTDAATAPRVQVCLGRKARCVTGGLAQGKS